jgi:hypothetical protein
LVAGASEGGSEQICIAPRKPSRPLALADGVSHLDFDRVKGTDPQQRTGIIATGPPRKQKSATSLRRRQAFRHTPGLRPRCACSKIPTVSSTPCDGLIIGGSPSGSSAAPYLARASKRGWVLEKEILSRFHIGESRLPDKRAILATGPRPPMPWLAKNSRGAGRCAGGFTISSGPLNFKSAGRWCRAACSHP